MSSKNLKVTNKQREKMIITLQTEKTVQTYSCYLPCTPSGLQLRILPTRTSSIKGRNTTQRNLTLVWAAPSPGNMNESSIWIISCNAIQRPTLSTTCEENGIIFNISKEEQIRLYSGYGAQAPNNRTLFASFLFSSSAMASDSFTLNFHGGVLITCFISARTNITKIIIKT